MNTEIEAKFVNVDHDIIRQRLTAIGATLQTPMRVMRRVTIDSPEMLGKNSFVRVRDQGDKVTLTYKQFDTLSVDGAKEIEVDVSEFQATIDLLAAAGLPHKSFQESKRETWNLGSTEIVLDLWPWLNPYIEIEGQSEQDVRDAAAKLDLGWNDVVFGDVMAAYKIQYPHLNLLDTVGNIPIVKFGDPLPELLRP
jgi:adenylate cyclase class 2